MKAQHNWWSLTVKFLVELFRPQDAKKVEKSCNPSEQVFAYNHPLLAKRVDELKNLASNVTNQIFGDGATSIDGNVGNAFKHAYWNALMCRDIGYKFAKIVGDNHEEYLDPDAIHQGFSNREHSATDYFYNDLGRKSTHDNAVITDGELAYKVLTSVLNDRSHILNNEDPTINWDYFPGM